MRKLNYKYEAKILLPKINVLATKPQISNRKRASIIKGSRSKNATLNTTVKLKTTNVRHEATRKTTINTILTKGVSNRCESQLIPKHTCSFTAGWPTGTGLQLFPHFILAALMSCIYPIQEEGDTWRRRRERERRTRTYTPLHIMFTVHFLFSKK